MLNGEIRFMAKVLTKDQIEAMTQSWTKSELIDALEQLSKKHFDTDLAGFTELLKSGKVDSCKFMEMIGLYNQLSGHERK